MDERPPATEAERRELDRVGAFSDGVFAIAITLLVLNLNVPELKPDETLADALRNLDSDISAYFIGFAVIGFFWYGHHRLFSVIDRSDPILIFINLVLLSLIALMPFTTDLLGSYDEAIAVAVYAANVGAAALADGLTEFIAVRRRLVPTGALGSEGGLLVAALMRTGVFVLSIPIAYAIDPDVAQYCWLLLLVVPRLSVAVAKAPA
jgi:uncharacterized membrane protein